MGSVSREPSVPRIRRTLRLQRTATTGGLRTERYSPRVSLLRADRRRISPLQNPVGRGVRLPPDLLACCCNQTPRHRVLRRFTQSAAPRANHDARNTRIRCRQGRHRPRLRIGRSRVWSRSGNENAARDVSVALPEGHLAGEEGIVRRRLYVAVGVEGP